MIIRPVSVVEPSHCNENTIYKVWLLSTNATPFKVYICMLTALYKQHQTITACEQFARCLGFMLVVTHQQFWHTHRARGTLWGSGSFLMLYVFNGVMNAYTCCFG